MANSNVTTFFYVSILFYLQILQLTPHYLLMPQVEAVHLDWCNLGKSWELHPNPTLWAWPVMLLWALFTLVLTFAPRPYVTRIHYKTAYSWVTAFSFWMCLPYFLHPTLWVSHREIPSHLAMAETRQKGVIAKPQTNICSAVGPHNAHFIVKIHPLH